MAFPRAMIVLGLQLALLLPVDAWSATGPLMVQPVSDHVYAVVGPFGNRDPENLGNNSTHGFVVTPDGVVVVDPGGSYRGAAAIHALIKDVTPLPVRVVINTGGQDHRWLGNGYFREQGARIIASEAAVVDQRSRARDQLLVLNQLVGAEGMAGTEPVYADETFQDRMNFELGDVTFELMHVGPAHTPGDSLVWLPGEQIVFSGDVVYVERMLGVLPVSNTRNWIDAFDRMAALAPEVIIPGHGPATDLDQATRDTRAYLLFLREAVGEFLAAGQDLADIGTLDLSRFSHLVDADTLSGRNAQQVFQEMEWE